MKADELSCKDLMVGDWVQGNPCGQHCDRNNNTYYKIAVLDIGNHCWGYTVCGAIVELKYDNIFSIPLTPEILEKNGFIKQDFEGWLYFKQKDDNENKESLYSIMWRNDYYLPHLKIASFTSEYGGYSRLNIQYVHELQHALRLCGIEKEIEL